MPLSKPTPRNLIHNRDIRCRGFKRDDGLWDIEADLMDTKTYSFANQDRNGINSGEPIHHMRVRITIDDDLLIHDAEAVLDSGPHMVCGDLPASFSVLKGLTIQPGWRKAVRERIGKARGCTHITDLLLGPVATVAIQTMYANKPAQKPVGNRPKNKKPPHLGTCHALKLDGQFVKERWPEFYTGD